jgi:RNA polymerase sigma-B factor
MGRGGNNKDTDTATLMNYQQRQTLNQELFASYKLNPTHQVRSHIFNVNTGLAQAMARNFTAKCKEPYNDLFQEAAKGLWIAITKFDPARGGKFNSYAGMMMRHEICKYLRDKTPDVKVPRSWYDLWERGNKLQREQVSGAMSDNAIALALGVSVERWHEACTACAHRFAQTLELPIVQARMSDTWELPKEEFFITLEEHIPSDIFESYNFSEIERVCLDGLSDGEIAIAQSFFSQGKTLKFVTAQAVEMNIRRSRVKRKLREIAIAVTV